MLTSTNGRISLEAEDIESDRIRINKALGRKTTLTDQQLIDVMSWLEGDLDDPQWVELVSAVEKDPHDLQKITESFN